MPVIPQAPQRAGWTIHLSLHGEGRPSEDSLCLVINQQRIERLSYTTFKAVRALYCSHYTTGCVVSWGSLNVIVVGHTLQDQLQDFFSPKMVFHQKQALHVDGGWWFYNLEGWWFSMCLSLNVCSQVSGKCCQKKVNTECCKHFASPKM